MGKFFNSEDLPVRAGSHSVKWDGMAAKYGRGDLQPLWVADMDYPSPPCIQEALKKAVDFGVYGYFAPPASYQEAFINWEKERHGVDVKAGWIRFTPGVVTGLYWSISALTLPGDAVMILTPCYYPFMDAVRDTGRRLVCCDLRDTGRGYALDAETFARTLADENVKMLLLCSPHNPVGHVWSEEELRFILDECRRNNVIVVSDEIHQDIVFNGHKHLSCLRFEEHLDHVIVLTAASKTFNIAGLQNSFAVIPNDELGRPFDAYVKSVRIKKGVSLGYIAAEAGYREGAPWLEEVLAYIQGNYELLHSILTEALPEIRVVPLESTYMIWVDLSAYVRADELVDVVQEKAGLAVDYGFWFWPEDKVPADDAHIRVNVAASRANVERAARALVKAIQEK